MPQLTPKAYFIGGAPRVGKSTLAQAILQERPMQFVATDDLRTKLRQTTPASIAPDLYYLDSLNADESNMAFLMREKTSMIIDATDRESNIVWPKIEEFARTQLDAGHDVLIEGVAVLPRLLAKLDFNFSAVFLGNQSPAHGSFIHEFANTHSLSWLASLEPGTIDAFAKYCQRYSLHCEQQAIQSNLTYLEMSNLPFTDAVQLARTILLAR